MKYIVCLLAVMNFQSIYSSSAQKSIPIYTPAHAILWITNNDDKSTEYAVTFKSEKHYDITCVIKKPVYGLAKEEYFKKTCCDEENELYEDKCRKPHDVQKELNQILKMAKSFGENSRYYRRKFNIFVIGENKVMVPCNTWSVLAWEAKK